MTTLKLTQIDNSAGVARPTELLAWLKPEEGAMVFATDAANEATPAPCDKAFGSQMAPR